MPNGDEGLRLKDWIGKWVTVNIVTNPTGNPGERAAGISGSLEGVDPMGVIILFDPQDAAVAPGQEVPPEVTEPRHVFHPWHRVHLIEHTEAKPTNPAANTYYATPDSPPDTARLPTKSSLGIRGNRGGRPALLRCGFRGCRGLR